ncbi:MAG: ATP-binding cassette domain-containing protein [Burkholderiaceae bacterium]|nr:ATP-binding cassette domain-containing protein [Burkholderiaceae bacterium]MDH3461485.1 ATP-binding cassette domain-containing protein [Burkholderiaceae bacterium]
MSHLALNAVSVRYPGASADAFVLREANLSVARGEALAVIGPSGAGKTTLLLAAVCALPLASGDLSLMGQRPWTLSRRSLHALRARLFLAPQTPPLPPRQRVVTAVLAGRLSQQGLAASLRSLFYPSDIPAARNALAHFDLADKLFERVDRLSSGERQRVGLARALVSGAELLLIDEPLSALDPARAGQAIASLRTAARESGATLITTLHQVEVARASFERIVGLRAGRVMFDLPAAKVSDAMLRELYADHEDELTPDRQGATPGIGASPPVPARMPVATFR